MDSRNGHHHRMTGPTSRDLTHAMQEHQRELARLERIRLDAPRPDADRFVNDYVDAPKLPVRKQQPTSQLDSSSSTSFKGKTGAAPVAAAAAAHDKCGHARHENVPTKKGLDTDHFFTKQPCSGDEPSFAAAAAAGKRSPCAIHGQRDREDDLKKMPEPASLSSPIGIICPECGECRCSACMTPKKLPSYWLCNGNFECSAENLVDQLSCLCCVKGLFYHFDETSSSSDHPCTCVSGLPGARCCQRWTVMGLLSVTCLPCLLCYWPCRGLAGCSAKCYAAYHKRGCRCPPPPLPSSSASSTESSPVASIRPLTSRKSSPAPPAPPSRPGHAFRISAGNSNSGFSKNGVFL